MDLINRQEALKTYPNIVCKGICCNDCRAKDRDDNCVIETWLNSLPSAQSERNTGCWIGIDDEPCDVYECNQCGTTYDTVDNTWDLPYFCPNCGASMGKEKCDGRDITN